MSLFSLINRKGSTGFGYGSTALDVTAGLDLTGQTILVTGCNSGLGQEAMRVLALRGARVVAIARTEAKAKAALVKGASALACELSDPASIRACIATINAQGIKLDAVIANAGIMALPKLELLHGYEAQFFTNHIGHFRLVTGLLDQLTDTGRVVMLSSSAHTMAPKGGIEFDNLDGNKGYRPWTAYGQSKIANLLFAKSLAARFAGTGRSAFAVHPGVIATNLGRSMNPAIRLAFIPLSPLFMKTIAQGTATEVFCAVHQAAPALSGNYFADVNVAECQADANDPALARKLWDVSEKIIA